MNSLPLAASIPHPLIIRARIRELNQELILARRLFAVSVLARSPATAPKAPARARRKAVANAR